jgi:aminoglycoside phosphotransferase (APT) family kinase protein
MRHRWKRPTPAIEVSASAAQDMVRWALPKAEVLDVRPIQGGLANTNVQVVLDRAPGTVLLRLYQRDPTQAEKEAAISQRLRGVVPVPTYLHIGAVDEGRRFAIVEWVEGAGMANLLSDASPDQTRQLGREAGRVLAAIHSVHFDRNGFLDGELRVARPLKVDAEWLAAYLRGSFIEGGGARFVDRALADAVIAYVRRNGDLSWGGPPCLTHFDYNGWNILVSDGEISGVLDWEFAFAGSPDPDFGNLIRNHPDPSFQDAAADGYRDAGGRLPANWRKLARIADLGSWAEFLYRPEVDPILVEDALAALRATIAD